jgi:hypothetical protein
MNKTYKIIKRDYISNRNTIERELLRLTHKDPTVSKFVNIYNNIEDVPTYKIQQALINILLLMSKIYSTNTDAKKIINTVVSTFFTKSDIKLIKKITSMDLNDDFAYIVGGSKSKSNSRTKKGENKEEELMDITYNPRETGAGEGAGRALESMFSGLSDVAKSVAMVPRQNAISKATWNRYLDVAEKQLGIEERKVRVSERKVDVEEIRESKRMSEREKMLYNAAGKFVDVTTKLGVSSGSSYLLYLQLNNMVDTHIALIYSVLELGVRTTQAVAKIPAKMLDTTALYILTKLGYTFPSIEEITDTFKDTALDEASLILGKTAEAAYSWSAFISTLAFLAMLFFVFVLIRIMKPIIGGFNNKRRHTINRRTRKLKRKSNKNKNKKYKNRINKHKNHKYKNSKKNSKKN